MPFESEAVLPFSLLQRITELRVDDPGAARRQAAGRKRRQRLCRDGRLVVLAADHPGRGVTAVPGDPLGMGDRHDYLARILRVLSVQGVDGVMSTPDVLEELLLLERLAGTDLLADRLLIGCLNRGGVAGTAFEMRDRFGAYTAAGLARMHLDGAKLMFRLDRENPDSGATIQDCARALRALEEQGLAAFLEPLMVQHREGRYQVLKTPQDMITAIGVATALGNTSQRLWLKIPYTDDYARVARATTCPILMLGGEAKGDPAATLQNFAAGLSAAPNVRGLLVGRNILYPGERDPASMAAAVAVLVHDGASPHGAARRLEQH